MLRFSLKRRGGFTLIELMIVIGIIGTLASMTIIAVSPNKQLAMAQDAARVSNVKQIQNALTQYLLDVGSFPTGIPSSTSGIPICKQGITAATCVNLDTLIPKYIVALPQDSWEANANHSGYIVDINNGRPEVQALYMSGNPRSFAGLVLWTRADVGVYKDAGTTIAAPGETVQQWSDLSGTNNHMTQATVGIRPQYVSNAINGKPALFFNNAPWMQSTASLTSWTIFAVVNHTDGASFTNFRRFIDGNDGLGFSIFGVSGTTVYNSQLDYPRNINSANFRVNGAITLSAAPLSNYKIISAIESTSTSSFIWYGTYQASGAQSHLGNIAEIIIYNTALSTADRQAVEQYLSNRYGIAVTKS